MKKKKFRNIGPVSESWLNEIGIDSLEELEKIGPYNAFEKIQQAGFNPSKNFLYALIGAIQDEDWKIIADAMKNKSKLKSNS